MRYARAVVAMPGEIKNPPTLEAKKRAKKNFANILFHYHLHLRESFILWKLGNVPNTHVFQKIYTYFVGLLSKFCITLFLY
jgi:hypothetical protein